MEVTSVSLSYQILMLHILSCLFQVIVSDVRNDHTLHPLHHHLLPLVETHNKINQPLQMQIKVSQLYRIGMKWKCIPVPITHLKTPMK